MGVPPGHPAEDDRIANKGFQGKFLPGKPGGIADEYALSPKEPTRTPTCASAS